MTRRSQMVLPGSAGAAALNRGWSYRDRVAPGAAGLRISTFYRRNYPHSDAVCWRRRIADGEIELNGVPARDDRLLAAGDELVWHRPPWQEPEVPRQFTIVRFGSVYRKDLPLPHRQGGVGKRGGSKCRSAGWRTPGWAGSGAPIRRVCPAAATTACCGAKRTATCRKCGSGRAAPIRSAFTSPRSGPLCSAIRSTSPGGGPGILTPCPAIWATICMPIDCTCATPRDNCSASKHRCPRT